jgi:hypothetical protein
LADFRFLTKRRLRPQEAVDADDGRELGAAPVEKLVEVS